jgi:hypothetical protein
MSASNHCSRDASLLSRLISIFFIPCESARQARQGKARQGKATYSESRSASAGSLAPGGAPTKDCRTHHGFQLAVLHI